FYQPAQIVIDARKHDVEFRPVDINHSYWDNILEEKTGQYYTIRLGFRQVKGLRAEEMETLVNARTAGYKSIVALMDIGISQSTLEILADADAFRSIGLDRRQALWEVSALYDRPVALFEGQPSESTTETQISLPLMTEGEHVIQDYAAISLSLKAHPLSFIREKLKLLHIISAQELGTLKNGTLIKITGLVLVRQRPGTASGICFITIEDETGSANLVVFQKLFDQYRKEILGSKLLMVEGKVQIEGEVIHVIVQRCFNLNGMLKGIKHADDFPVLAVAGADEKNRMGVLEKEVIPKARNFK
ncbi:MAG: error-prone DNA polymerase, partial [Pyrinomonadaceae bacterium]|nr:error-prone DNA polymerase [Sphingobacteriaceae bacterium]